MSELLIIQNVKKSYKLKDGVGLEVLKGVSLNVKDDDYIALMGPSGVGKSTLLHICGSLDNPDSGTIALHVEGEVFDYSKINADKLAVIRNKYIGFIFQFHHLLPEFTALENVMMPALIAGHSFAKAKEKAMALIDRVGMGHRIKHKPKEISGGEQQRIAVARALINEPKIILADEPTGNLDSTNTESILALIDDIRKEMKVAFIIATHGKEVAERAASIINMKDGYIV